MLDDREQAKLDQEIAQAGEMLPTMYWALYSGCVERGFTENQAMAIVLEFIAKPSFDCGDPSSTYY